MRSTSTIRLDRDALEHNLRTLRRLAGEQGSVCAVVKADAYGIGAERIVPQMVAQGVDFLAVFSLSEAMEIGKVAQRTPILVLMPVRELIRDQVALSLLTRGQLHLVAHDEAQVADLEDDARAFGIRLPLHLELDTGMGRGGCSPEEAARVLARIAASSRLELAGLMTHLPDPIGDPDHARMQRTALREFREAHRDLVPEGCRVHLAATAATLREESLRLDMLRVGIAWAGIVDHLVRDLPDQRGIPEFRPLLSWWSQFVHVRRLPEGDTVGYGSTWRAKRPSVIGLVPVGYADGYPASRDGMTHRVIVHGRSGKTVVPVVGRVNMDQITVDLTDAGPIEPGDAVELISSDGQSQAHLPLVAARAGMQPYAVLTGLGHRIPRILVAGESSTASPVSSSAVASTARFATGG
ncbi:MAG: alanine racemase [Phycisphaerales bacterium]|nr:alanine racemase [Phycisphaerales bacterium]